MMKLKFDRDSFENWLNQLNEILELFGEFDDCFITIEFQKGNKSGSMNMDFTIEGSN